MTKLYNKKGRVQLLEDLAKETFSRKICSFYRYTPLVEVEALRDALFVEWSQLSVLGRVYVANEGINAQISVPEPHWDDFLANLESRPAFQDMPFKMAVEDGERPAFLKLIVRVKQEIVAYQVPASEYDMNNIGPHLDYQAFNQAIDDGAIVIDMRNRYEGEVGRFENAIIPEVVRSQELLPEVKNLLKGREKEKVLIYCTGGIRCEKASAYLRHHGFEDINQLKGGIIQYANDIKKAQVPSKFIGKNFVFDARMGERITDDILSNCHVCGEKSDRHINCANQLCHILFIECETCSEKLHHCCSEKCAEFVQLPESQQRAHRKDKNLTFTAQLSDNIKPRLDEVYS